MGQLDDPGDTGAETYAIVGSRDVIVHRLGDADYLDSLLVQTLAVAEGVISADGNQMVDAQELEIPQDVGGGVVHLRRVPVLEVGGNYALGQVARPRPGGVYERSARAGGPVYDVLSEDLNMGGVVCFLVGDDIYQPRPPPADSMNPCGSAW